MANINVGGLIKEADKAIETRNVSTEKVASLRELLRFSVKAGEASAEEAAWIEEAFPTRLRKTAEERVAELEEQLTAASSRLIESSDSADAGE